MGILQAMQLEYAGKGAYKEKGAEGVALRNSFMQCVGDHVVDVERSRRVGSEVYAGRDVIEKAKP